jgi:hypothetical protein
MVKKIRFNTISLGSEPEQPDILALSGFISSHRGFEADLISYKLVSSLTAQKNARVYFPCGGGPYMLPRFESAITCSNEECHGDPSSFIADAETMIRTAGPVRSALPAPDQIPSCPDLTDEEQYADFCDMYSSILRSMRDKEVTGHILHATRVCQIDVERLASRKTLFINPDGNMKSQEMLLEFQKTIVLNTTRIPMLRDLIDQYDISSLAILDPDKDGFKEALRHLDPDQISVGGFGKGLEGEYWKKIVDGATIAYHPE